MRFTEGKIKGTKGTNFSYFAHEDFLLILYDVFINL